MKQTKFVALAVFVFFSSGLAAQASSVVLVDDFSDGNLAEYTQTLILDQNPTSDISFSAAGGVLQVSKSAGTEAEQVLLLRDDYQLKPGQTLRVDLDWGTTSRADIGIAVAATASPAPLVYDSLLGGTQERREDFVIVYAQADVGNIKSLGVDGTFVPPTIFANSIPFSDRDIFTGLYIHRATTNEFIAGYSTPAGDTNFASWTIANAAVGNAIGFFADVRSVTSYGSLDNLRIVPEPGVGLLLALGSLVAVLRVRR